MEALSSQPGYNDSVQCLAQVIHAIQEVILGRPLPRPAGQLYALAYDACIKGRSFLNNAVLYYETKRLVSQRAEEPSNTLGEDKVVEALLAMWMGEDGKMGLTTAFRKISGILTYLDRFWVPRHSKAPIHAMCVTSFRGALDKVKEQAWLHGIRNMIQSERWNSEMAVALGSMLTDKQMHVHASLEAHVHAVRLCFIRVCLREAESVLLLALSQPQVCKDADAHTLAAQGFQSVKACISDDTVQALCVYEADACTLRESLLYKTLVARASAHSSLSRASDVKLQRLLLMASALFGNMHEFLRVFVPIYASTQAWTVAVHAWVQARIGSSRVNRHIVVDMVTSFARESLAHVLVREYSKYCGIHVVRACHQHEVEHVKEQTQAKGQCSRGGMDQNAERHYQEMRGDVCAGSSSAVGAHLRKDNPRDIPRRRRDTQRHDSQRHDSQRHDSQRHDSQRHDSQRQAAGGRARDGAGRGARDGPG